jgi:hypothetical protein
MSLKYRHISYRSVNYPILSGVHINCSSYVEHMIYVQQAAECLPEQNTKIANKSYIII